VGNRSGETGWGAANSLYKHIKTMSILEAIVGTHSSDLYDAIFDVELSPENSDDEDIASARSISLREDLHHRSIRSRLQNDRPKVASASRSDISPLNRGRLLPQLSPTHLNQASSSLAESGQPVELPTRSPLARLFTSDISPRAGVRLEKVGETNVRKIETLLEDIKDLPIHRLKDEMKELQDQQARIEGLLLTLTRSMGLLNPNDNL